MGKLIIILLSIILALILYLGVIYHIEKKEKQSLYDSIYIIFTGQINSVEYGSEFSEIELIDSYSGEAIYCSELNIYQLGDQEIKFIVSLEDDKYGHFEKEYFYTVRVEDTNAPVIEFKVAEVEIIEGDNYSVKSNIKTCKDVVDGDLEPVIISNLDINTPGNYTVKVSATDRNGNVTQEYFVVTVKKSNRKQHYVNTSNLPSIRYQRKYTKEIYNALINEDYNRRFAAETRESLEFQYSLYELEDRFFGKEMDIHFTYDHAVQAFNLLIDDENRIRNEVEYAKQRRINYLNYIRNALSKLNLYSSDEELVNQINQYIVRNFSYKKTDIYIVSSFTELKKGQCWHYAMLFRDMCAAVDIEATYVQGYAYGTSHAWNRVVLNGNKYYFDVTLNDTLPTTSWSWLSESEIRRTHKW